MRKHRSLLHGSHFGTHTGRLGLPGCCWSALKGCSGPALAYLISKFLQEGLHALQFFCTCCTCENTAIYRTGATLALKMAARACPMLLKRSEGPFQTCFGATSALEMATSACSGAASALKKAAQACFDAASALKIAILDCSGGTSALKKPVRARFCALSALKEAVPACCLRSLFKSAGLGYTLT